MKYGISIAPVTFFDTKPQFFTKQGFANYMARALQSVGMIPLSAINYYDLADPANAERDPGGNENAAFWFDYPTNEYFTVNNVQYKPCFGIVNDFYRSWPNSDSVVSGKTIGYYVGSNVGFKHFRRRVDRINRNDMICAENLTFNYNTFHGLGGYNDTYGYWNGQTGAIVGWSKWKLFNTWTDVNMQELLFVNRVFVHLSQAGLVVQVGSHPNRRDETCNILNFMAAFHGGRIPNREKPVIDDVLRDMNDPIAWFDLGAYSDDVFANQTRGDMYTGLLGSSKVVSGTKSSVNAVTAGFLRSINYLDDAPFNNTQLDVYPRPSPTILNGNGVHLLHRAALCSHFQYNAGRNNSGLYTGIIDSVKAPNLIGSAKWSDVYFLHGIALSDRIVPPGLKTDPTTSKQWYMIWSTPRGQSFGIDYTGVSTISDLTAGAENFTLMESIPLDVTSIGLTTPPYTRSVSRSDETFKIGTSRTLINTFTSLLGNINMYVSQFELSNVDVAANKRWNKPAGVNMFSLPAYGWIGSYDATKHMQLNIELDNLSTDYRDVYYVEYEYRGRTSSSPSIPPENYDNHYQYVYIGGGWSTEVSGGLLMSSFMRVGSSAYQNFYYNFKSYGVKGTHYLVAATDKRTDVQRFQPSTNGKATIMFNAAHNYGDPNSIYHLSVDIQNIVIKRYRRS